MSEGNNVHTHGHHHHHHHAPKTLSKIFILCIILNLLFVVIETVVGFMSNSVGLLSDAGHNLGDVFSLLLALLAIKMATIKANRRFTYGYRKITVLVSLLNAVILLVAVGAIIIESISRLSNPQTVSGSAITWTAAAGIVINGLTAWLLMKDQKHDLNVRGAFLHMLADTLVSAGVVVAGIVISFTGLVWLDAAISLTIAVIILVTTFNMLKESLSLSLDGVPEDIDVEEIEKRLMETEGVKDWHHLHIWAISTTENAATLHVMLQKLEELEKTKEAVKRLFAEHNIGHCTIEFETEGCSCKDVGMKI